ncbi:MAG TPA: hypothetical protein P5105_05990 [Victivallales bacterium]|nr:hypothetical protein [Victivallales bacterium]HRR06816.1 hypothetical protein [Victivallales bacterium]HRR28316.1 hypothetical protein [Victivallales bacterium]HRU01619.1 hypothetical protein [Victivallales bacterium]
MTTKKTIVLLGVLIAGLVINSEEMNKVKVGEFLLSTEGWELNLGKEFPGAEGNLWWEEEEGCAAKGAASLEGNFASGGNYVSMVRFFPEKYNIKGLSFQIRTKDLTSVILRLVDSTNQTFQVKIPLKDTTEWQNVNFDISNLVPGKFMVAWGGAGDGQWHGPAKGMSILIDKGCFKFKDNKKGLILIDDVELIR